MHVCACKTLYHRPRHCHMYAIYTIGHIATFEGEITLPYRPE